VGTAKLGLGVISLRSSGYCKYYYFHSKITNFKSNFESMIYELKSSRLSAMFLPHFLSFSQEFQSWNLLSNSM
jgi:hypothetical protein